MSTPHDDYKRLEFPSGTSIEPCPVCAADAELWQYSTADDAPTSKAVMCTRGDQFGPQSGLVDEGCLLYMPPQGFYKSTIREALAYWNEYAKALTKIARAERWKRHSALREPTGAAQ